MSSVCEGKQSEAGILVLEFVSEMSPQSPVLLACFPSGGAAQDRCDLREVGPGCGQWVTSGGLWFLMYCTLM